MAEYKPELGQMCFGTQAWQPHACSNLCEAVLFSIKKELDRLMWNIHQVDYDSPFGNTGNSYKCDAFEVHAYSWDETREQKFNFKWKDVEICWYKYLGRGMPSNKELTPDILNTMLDECLAELEKVENEMEQRGDT